jgi:outer membrane protein assembly factor BamA
VRNVVTRPKAAAVRPGVTAGRGSILILLLGCLVAAPAVAQPVPAGAREVKSLRFEGVRSFDQELLRSAIVTRSTGCRNPVLHVLFVCAAGVALDRHYLDPTIMRADELRVRLFYYQRGYRNAQVVADTVPQGGGVRVVFRVEEGEAVRVRRIGMEGAAELPIPGLTRRLPLQEGQAFSLLDLEATRDTLVDRLRNHGYARAEVLIGTLVPVDSPYVAVVQYDIYAGEPTYLGAIEVVGAELLSEAVVRRMLVISPGDLYRQDALLASQRNLFGLEIIRHAEIRAHLAETVGDTVPVTVQVNEGNAHRVRLGAGLNTAECGNTEGRWTSRNFMGGARRFEVRGRLANVMAGQLGGAFPCLHTGGGIYDDLTGSLAVDFVQPWFFSPRNTFGTGLYAERRSVPDVFVRSAVGGYVSFSRPISRRTSMTFGFRPELTELVGEGDRFFCVSFIVCDERDIRVLQEPHWLAPLTISLARDFSNSIFAPTRGYIARLEAEHGSRPTGSDFSYVRLSGELSTYREVTDGVVLATRLRPGFAQAIRAPGADSDLGLHPQKRYFAGGPNSVRGFAQYRLGPKVLTVDAAAVLGASVEEGGAGCTVEAINSGACQAQGLPSGRFDVQPIGGTAVLEGNFEVRFPLGGDLLRGAAFIDFGQLWGGEAMRLRDVVWTPGVGLRYFSPVGPIRVDLGYNPLGAELLPVITTEVEVCARQPDGGCLPAGNGVTGPLVLRNRNKLRALDEPVLWNPRGTTLERFQLHLSIGQAF